MHIRTGNDGFHIERSGDGAWLAWVWVDKDRSRIEAAFTTLAAAAHWCVDVLLEDHDDFNPLYTRMVAETPLPAMLEV